MDSLKKIRPKLGLTWRVIALTSLLLLGLTTAFTFVSRDNLLRQFNDSRNDQVQRQAREIRQALNHSMDSLRQIAALNASLTSGLENALKQADRATIASSFNNKWPTLQLEAGIDELVILDETGQQLVKWGYSQAGHNLPFAEWGKNVIASDMPFTTLRCFADCRQYAVAPILVDGKSHGAVLISRSLADVTRQAHEVSGSDVALLITGQYAQDQLDITRSVSAWHGKLATLTNQENTLPLIHQAAYLFTLEELQNKPARLKHSNKYIEISTIKISRNNKQGETGHFILISDITSQIYAINRDTGTILATGLIGWLAAEVMLLVILWKPMARVRRLSSVLPALAEGGFAKAKQMIPMPKRRLLDEIDLLDATALDLACQLETLEGEVKSRGELLNARLEELARERDFIENLLDTAHVLILTQDNQGKISLVNQYCQDIFGQPYDIILGQRFEALFHKPSDSRFETSDHQAEERLLRGKDEEQRTIVWYHARLSDSNDPSMHTISVGIDITDRKAAESRLAWLASRDSLTGLYNRRAFQERIEEVFEKEEAGAVLFMDLDQFKDVNELSGHPAGDKLLQLVARNIENVIGERGFIARLGGDEFSVLLENASENEAVEIAQNIENNLDETSLLLHDGRLHRASVSIGIACYPLHGPTPAELMANADVAMYKAKESSLKRWHMLSTIDEAKNELQKRVYWIERIRHALQNNEFELMTQPIIKLSDGSVKHYEILLRLRGDGGELISPGTFIPIAEQSGQIIQIDRWVLHHSLILLKEIQEDGVSLSVNLSGQSLHEPGINSFLSEELKRSGANPNQLILEVTETAAVTDFSTANNVLLRMRNLGCQTALDDFGVGFSSLHYLGQLPMDFIKVDGSFIKDLSSNYKNQLIVKAVTEIAKGFGKAVIAEFVDSTETANILKEYGVTFGQGYFLGEPKEISDTKTRHKNHE